MVTFSKDWEVKLDKTKRLLSNQRAINRLQKERIKLLETKIEILEWDISRLKEGLGKPRPEPSMTPLWMDEQEEDILFAKNAGLIAPETASAMLAELEFDNPVVVPYDDAPL